MAAPIDPWSDGLHALGAPFMVSTHLQQECRAVGMAEHTLYFRGRVGPLGDLTASSAAQLLAVFPHPLVAAVWSRTVAVPAADATPAYLRACHAWGRDRLADDDDTRRLAKILAPAAAAATSDHLPLANAWSQVELPADAPARLAQAAMVLREIRGGLHFAALALQNLPIRRALAINEENQPGRLARTGWRPDAVREVLAESQPGDRELWSEAETSTGTALRRVLSEVLDDATVAEAGTLLGRIASSPG